VELALQIAEAVLQRELACLDNPAADAVRRALTSVPPTLAATVRLNPAELARLDPAAVEGHPITLVGDPSVAGGDARVETETRVVDASVSAAMARVREVLGRG